MAEIQMPPITDKLSFVAIDIETTGLEPHQDEIIELAAVRFVAGEEKEKYSTFVKPRRGLPKFIELLTHISPEDLNNAPEINAALPGFLEFLGKDVLVGHNVGFDTGFINHYAALAGNMVLANHCWDTAEISRVYLPYTSDHKLQTIALAMGVELTNAHRAEADARAAGWVLIRLSQYVVKHFPLLTNARLLDLSRQAQLQESLYRFLYEIVEYQRRYVLMGAKTQYPDVARPNVLEHEVKQAATLPNEQVFSEHGLFARLFPRFEFRSGQLQMAQEVERTFSEGGHLAVEAGTGVGKSFAYLVPAISFANRTKTKVVVSTNTKNLQEQLFFKDLPQLKEMLPLPFKAALVKGRENYICERRWEEFLHEQTRGITAYEAQALLNLFIWKQLTKSGDVSENSSFDRNRFSIVWRKICSDRFQCLGRKCPHAGKCYVLTLRKAVETSSVVVTNHSLLLADMRMDNTTLGEFQYLIVDEAHNLMSAASRILGFELSYADTANLLNQLVSVYKRRSSGFIHQLEITVSRSVATQGQKDHLLALCKNFTALVPDIRGVILELFTEAAKRCSDADSYGKLRIKSTAAYPRLYELIGRLIKGWKDMIKQLQAMANVFASLNAKQVPNYDALSDSLNSFLLRSAEMEGNWLEVENPNLEDYALWIENGNRPESKQPQSVLCYSPVDVSTHLNRLLYQVISSIVFTSATLALRGSFKYFFAQSGLALVPAERLRQSIVDSPFDYGMQSSLMVSSFLPEHKDKFFLNQALGCVEQIVRSVNVGTMILFTSYRDLNSVYDHLSDILYRQKRPLFAQGKAISRASMLEEFRKHKNAVLLGTNSFWEGVDIQGESLSLLILFKLPFQVPSEPVVESLIEKLDRESKDSFMHYMLPNALLKLRQGFGRLIRSKMDRGIVLIMDSRVTNKAYGQYFKQVLPAKCLEIKSELELINEISSFFNLS